MIGYAFCGSHCTLSASLAALRELLDSGYEVLPIFSERVATTDTRFWRAKEFTDTVESVCGRRGIRTIEAAEPLGPAKPLDALIIAPCSGNTLAKMALGITDTCVTMAAKAHLRCDRPTLIALATNDAMSANLANIGTMLRRRGVYFAPMHQDDPTGKPHSLVADFTRIPAALAAMLRGEQLRPLFL